MAMSGHSGSTIATQLHGPPLGAFWMLDRYFCSRQSAFDADFSAMVFGDLLDKAEPRPAPCFSAPRGILDLDDGCAIIRPIGDGLLFRDLARDLVTLHGIKTLFDGALFRFAPTSVSPRAIAAPAGSRSAIALTTSKSILACGSMRATSLSTLVQYQYSLIYLDLFVFGSSLRLATGTDSVRCGKRRLLSTRISSTKDRIKNLITTSGPARRRWLF